jgi:hypothetical protein
MNLKETAVLVDRYAREEIFKSHLIVETYVVLVEVVQQLQNAKSTQLFGKFKKIFKDGF